MTEKVKTQTYTASAYFAYSRVKKSYNSNMFHIASLLQIGLWTNFFHPPLFSFRKNKFFNGQWRVGFYWLFK